jgi:hypothetical protein
VTTDERLIRIEDKVDDLRELTAASTALHDACRNQQREHHATLYGETGLKDRVGSLEYSRFLARIGFTGLWAVVLVTLAAVLDWILKGF